MQYTTGGSYIAAFLRVISWTIKYRSEYNAMHTDASVLPSPLWQSQHEHPGPHDFFFTAQDHCLVLF